MSSYETKIDCPNCEKRTEGLAIDDYFGHRQYAYVCYECGHAWRHSEVEVIYAPRKKKGSDGPSTQ